MNVRFTVAGLLAGSLFTLGSSLSAQPPNDVPKPPQRGAQAPAAGEAEMPRAPGRNPMPRRGEGPMPRDGQDRPGLDGRPGPDGRGPDGRPGRMSGLEGRRDGRFPMGPPGPGMSGFPGDVRRLEQDDPEMYQLLTTDSDLERQTAEMADQYRRALPAEREKLKAGLGELIDKHFAVRQQRRELQLKRMEEEIQRLRDAIKARNDSREKIVNERITELTGE